MIAVQLCAQHPLLVAGFRKILEDQPGIRVVREAAPLSEIMVGDRSRGADVTVISAPPSDQDLWRRLPSTWKRPVVVVAGDEFDPLVLLAVNQGIRGIVGGRNVEDELTVAVRSVAAGNAYLSPKITEGLFGWLSRQVPSDPGRFVLAHKTLTEREREVLGCIGQGLTDAQIAEALVISRTTVRSHVYHIQTKLNLPNRGQAVLFGYQFYLTSGAN